MATDDDRARTLDRPARSSGVARLRAGGSLFLFALLFLAAGWSAYWYVATRAAMRELRVQIDREARGGREWSCSRMTTGGYPMSVEIDCDSPTLRANVDGVALVVHAPRAVISAPLYTPKLVVIDLSGPLDYSYGSSRNRAEWKRLQLSSRGLPDRLDRLSIVGENVAVRNTAGLLSVVVGAAQIHFRKSSPASDAPYNLVVGLGGVKSDALDELTNSITPALFTLVSAISQVDKATTGSWPHRLERWSAAGGRLTIGLASLTKGPMAAQAEGAVGLDQRRRLDGKLDVRLRDAGRAAFALAKRARLVAPDSLTARLAAAFLDRAGETKFAVTFENGELSIGPLKRILVLPPVY